ncbi:MAG: DUF692 domain-containing protein [Nitrospira sp.]|nr:DUF692 domain-containing protein [Nitrospira sp.]MCP9442274.1 DUF692 domain-containing protein [Nitrospira sp.]
MEIPNLVERSFLRRLERIQPHGLGLSLDVYSPDIFTLLGALRQRQVFPDYVEIFRAAPAALAAVRRRIGESLTPYHGEGLWLTQPGICEDPAFLKEVETIAHHLSMLDSAWLTHECATKSIAGYSYGTYLPPLYTEAGAAVVAENAIAVQAIFDRHDCFVNGRSPLLLLELPPLTYFVAGTLSIPTFFRLMTQVAPCGLVLDVGHLWTVFRYSGAWRTVSLERFIDEFLEEFPLHRVVQIHVAGLDLHAADKGVPEVCLRREAMDCPPSWIDAHGAPIPPLLFEMLDRILSNPRLTNLRGLALEVDTKAVSLIVKEFSEFQERYAGVFSEARRPKKTLCRDEETQMTPKRSVPAAVKSALESAYERYARIVSGQAEPVGPEWTQPTACIDELNLYRSVYLPYEILSWGGDVRAMFPESCDRLDEKGMPLSAFVEFWFRCPRATEGSYDFFLVKISMFVEFVRQAAPELIDIAEREADELRRAYDLANEPSPQAVGGA